MCVQYVKKLVKYSKGEPASRRRWEKKSTQEYLDLISVNINNLCVPKNKCTHAKKLCKFKVYLCQKSFPFPFVTARYYACEFYNQKWATIHASYISRMCVFPGFKNILLCYSNILLGSHTYTIVPAHT